MSETDELSDETGDPVLVELRKLRLVVQTLANRFAVARVYGIVIALLVAGMGYLIYDEHRTTTCLKAYASATFDRNAVLTPLSVARNKTFDVLLLDIVLNPQHKSNDAIKVEAVKANTAAQVYEMAVDTHPLPPSPTANCAIF